MNVIAPLASNLADALASSSVVPRAARSSPIRYHYIEPLVVLADVGVIFLASFLAAACAPFGGEGGSFGEAFGAAVIVASLFACLSKIRNGYGLSRLTDRRAQGRLVATAWICALALFSFSQVALGARLEVTSEFGLFALLGLAFLLALRFSAPSLIRWSLRAGVLDRRRIVLLTDRPESALSHLRPLVALQGYAVSQSFALPPAGAKSNVRKRLCAQLIEHARALEVEEIVVAAEPSRWTELRTLAGDLRILPLPITFLPIGPAADMLQRPTRDMGLAIGVELQRGPLSLPQRAAKRGFDLIVAGATLALLSPVMLIAMILVKLDSPGPILFRQRRCGFNGKTFVIRKFRTMSVLEDGATVSQARKSDPRVTRVGKWLRLTSVDELPQLLNVLDGSMSLVGPRPHALAHEGNFDKLMRNYAFRRRVKPGLTGWAQIHGCRGATPTQDLIERRVEYDLWYIDNWSLALDVAIVLRTPIELIRARNAH